MSWPCLFQVSWPTSWSLSSGNGPASRGTAPCLRTCWATSHTTRPSGRAYCPRHTEATAARAAAAKGPGARSRLCPKAAPHSAHQARPCSAHCEEENPLGQRPPGRMGFLPMNTAAPGLRPGALRSAVLLLLTGLPSFFQVYRSHSSPQH